MRGGEGRGGEGRGVGNTKRTRRGSERSTKSEKGRPYLL